MDQTTFYDEKVKIFTFGAFNEVLPQKGLDFCNQTMTWDLYFNYYIFIIILTTSIFKTLFAFPTKFVFFYLKSRMSLFTSFYSLYETQSTKVV